MIILGIETSCDETSASIISNGKVLSNIVYSQHIHQKYGGVVPSLASKDHENNIINVTNQALLDAKIKYSDLNAVAVTYGSGLLGSLIIGWNFAKGISLSLDIPLLPISHLECHLCSNLIDNKMNYPYACLIVSGGHTQIWIVNKDMNYEMVSNTVDDAAGEAFDKGARILGLKYPGGPEIENKAKNGKLNKYSFTIPVVKSNPLNFSFSGLKTSLLYKVQKISILDNEINDLCASYQESILDTLFNKLILVLDKYDIDNVAIVGGVSVNKRFRYKAEKLSKNMNVDIKFPNLAYCTDNAAMIAMAGYLRLLKNKDVANLEVAANPNVS